jgi:energy-coupling factor transporter ATP-binding protein EcfA2
MGKIDPKNDAYQEFRERKAQEFREQSKGSRDIGELPPPVDKARRAACLESFTLFRRTYFAEAFYLPDSSDHVVVSDQVEQVVEHGGLTVVAMPRGSGKTTLCWAAALWSMLKGRHRYVVIVGATADHASGMLESIKAQLETNELLAGDFPEVCLPIRRLEGIKQRRLLHLGAPVDIELGRDRVVLPKIAGSVASEGTIDAVGITGAIRGKQRAFSDGTVYRPTLVIIDDPQTEESAKSVSQCDDRERIINSAILGLVGPGHAISAIAPVTVICPGDLADRMLDRQRNPQWRGL